MSATTPTYGFPYPTSGDTPAGHTQMQALAEALEARVALVYTKIATVDPDATAPIGLHVRANANQTVGASGGAVKLTGLATNVKAPNGVSWNSGTSNLTISTSGVYAIYVSLAAPFAAGNNFGAACHLSAGGPAAGTPWIAAPLFSSGQTDSFAATTKYIDAGTVISPYVYNNGPALALNPTTVKPTEFSVWRVG